nr:hypothetical protein [Candidatus Sigynarchaeota archaeon]
MVKDLFFLLDHNALARIEGKVMSALKDESKSKSFILDNALMNYKNIMHTKVRMNVRLSNSVVLGLISMSIAGGYIYATMLNTGFFFLLHYIPYFFLLFFCADIIIGSISHVFLMRRILESFQPYLVIFPAHPDGIGGLGPLKELAINTTVVISSTVLVIPWLISIPLILESSLQYLSLLALAIVPLLMWLIASVFLYPTYILYKNISKAKDEKLTTLYDDYMVAFLRLQQVIKIKYNLTETPVTRIGQDENGEYMTDLQDLALYVNRLKEDYKEVMAMRSWPISTPTLWKLAGSVVLPALMPLVNWILSIL